MRAMAPEANWGFIKRAAGRLRANTIPARQKRGRIPRIADPIVQGYSMMDEAEETRALSELGRAALYRDGLLLVFLSYHPLRLRNLCFTSDRTPSRCARANRCSSISMRPRPKGDNRFNRKSRRACLAR